MDIIKLLRRAYRAYCRKKNWQRMVRAMAMVVVFCTTYALILPAITMESGTICGFVEHTHTDACYAPVTEPGTHVHGDECYAKKLICKLEEVEEHSHSDGCKGIVTTLVCTENHEHIGTCYLYEEGYICGLEETEGHSHGDACWEKKLICGQTEMGQLSALSLSSAKIAEEKEETKPVQRELICGLEEHSHSDACYPATEPETTEETEPSTGDPEADLETREDWEASMSAVTLTGDWSADILAVAVSQLGYTESQSNYIMDENGQTFHYTRYGQWCGAPYGDWSAKFVSFCLHYAQIDGIEAQQDCGSLWNAVKDADMLRMPGEYTPVIGDLVFVDAGEDCVCDAIGIVEKLEPETEEQAETITFIAGDWEGRVERVTMEAQDAAILGYAVLPTKPDDTQEHTYTGEDGTRAQVELDALTTSVPEDAVLSIAPLTEEAEEYAPLQAQVEALVSEEILGMTMLDISFYDAQGEYISVSDTARVSLTFPGNAFGDNAVKVFHFTEDGPTELSGVSYYYEYETAEDGTETMQTVLSFNTEGFSAFAVVEVVTSTDQYEQVDGIEATAMAGEYYILNYDSNAAMMATVTTDNKHGYVAISETTVKDIKDLSAYSLWTLELVSGNSYKIYNVDANGNKQYLIAQDAASGTADTSTWDLGALALTTDNVAATEFALTVNNGVYSFSYSNGSRTRYITDLDNSNLVKDENTPYGFTMHTDENVTDRERKLRLYREIPETIVPLTGLGGQKYAIVNLNTGNRQFAMTSEHVNENTKLKAVEVAVINGQDGNTYVSGDGITEWEFIATETPGEYYIKAVDTGKYLNFTGNGSENITTSDTKQVILVEIDSTQGAGQVTLKANNVKLNWIGANAGRGDIFGAWSGTDKNSRQTLCIVQSVDLFYDLNKPLRNNDAWYDSNPVIDADSQIISTEGAKLFEVTGSTVAGTYVADTFSDNMDIRTWYQERNNALKDAGELTADNYLAPDREYEFLGWEAKNTDGETCLFPEKAEAYQDAEGYICVKDTTGALQTLEKGTVLTGKWKVRSDIVLFFVNFGSTMLEGEDNKEIGQNLGASSFTDVVAFGHIYNPSDEKRIDTGFIRIEDHKTIENELRPYHDPNDSDMHIVIDAIAEFDDSESPQYKAMDTGCNETQLEQYACLYIQKNPDTSKRIKLTNAILEQSAIKPGNYKLYWYMQRDVSSDGWHIDGVLVAETESTFIYKTFSGLPNHMLDTSPANTLISQMEFPMHLLYTNSEDQLTRDSYTTLHAGQSQTGVYSADGWQRDSSNIYQWTLQMVLGQTYAFEETNHTLDDYECFSLISVHYNDPSETVVYEYNTTRSFKDIGTGSDKVPIEDLFNNGKDSYGNSITTEKGVEGGKVKSITFANFYTRTGTGMFSISKVADDAGQVRLPGATFVLKKKSDNTVVSSGTTNEYGSIHFSELNVGTYVLEETSPPPGYQKDNTKWQVDVQKDGTTFVSNGTTYDKVVVTIQPLNATGNLTGSATTVYDNQNGGIKDVYQIKNQPVQTTVEVNKYFNGITAEEVRRLYGNDATWTEGDYYIEVLDSTGNPVTTTETVLDANGDSQTVTKPLRLTLEDAHPMPGMLYNWTIDLQEGVYTFKEHNFLHSGYLDATVTAAGSGECNVGEVIRTDTDATDQHLGHDLATFTVTKGDAAGTVNIINTYTDIFTLRIHKIDGGTTPAKPLSGVEFEIYSTFGEGSGDTLRYQDENGVWHTVYYVDTITTDENGYADYDRMKIDNDTRSFLYVIEEVQAPNEEYVKLTDPIVQVVSIDSEHYANGVYTLEIENYKFEDTKTAVSITAEKKWDLPADMEKPESITLTLYQTLGNNAPTKMASITLNGTGSAAKSDNSYAYTIGSDGWSVTWSGLPYAETSGRYEYYVVEEPMAGYHTTYSYPESIHVNGELTAAGRAVGGKQLERSVTITNTSGYALPETGGTGTRWMAPLGLMLILAAVCPYWLGIEKKKQRGVDSS